MSGTEAQRNTSGSPGETKLLLIGADGQAGESEQSDPERPPSMDFLDKIESDMVEELSFLINDGTYGELDGGFSEYNFNKLGLPIDHFDVEIRRDIRRNIPVKVYILKSAHKDSKNLLEIFEKLGGVIN